MEIIYTLLSFTALTSFAVFFASKAKVPSSVSPLVAVSFTMIYLLIFGVFNALIVGMYLYFGLAIIIAGLIFAKKIQVPKLSVWFYGFIVVSVAMIIFFGIRQPLLYSWDEFSFWGTAVKMMKINHELPATAEIGWAWVASQKAGFIVMGYFFEFFGEYSQWRIFIGINVIAISFFCAILSPFKYDKKYIGIPLLIIAYLSSYIFTVNRELIEPSNVYMTALADIPMGWLMGAGFSIYYLLKFEKAKLWPVPLVLTALLMTKDTALPFALIAWGIISVDILFFNSEVEFFKFKGIKAKISHIILNLAVIIVGFFGWSLYIGAITGADPFGDIGGTGEVGMMYMMTQGLKELVGIGRTAEFQAILDMMIEAFFNLRISMIGSCFIIMLIISSILIIASFSTNDKEHKKSCISFNILSVLGFFAYYIFLGFTYVYIFKSDVNSSLIGYERYIYPYLIGWFIASVLLSSISLLKANKKFLMLPVLAVISVMVVFIYRYNQYIPSGMTYLDYHDGYLYEREELIEKSKELTNVLGEDEDGKIYFISQGDNGNKWFQYSADILPLQLEYSFGGGTMVLPGEASGIYDYELTKEEFAEYIIDNECEFVFVENSDENLIKNYGDLFNDNLKATAGGVSALYKTVNENNSLSFELLTEIYK